MHARHLHLYIWLFLGTFFSSFAAAAPSVSGNTISWPDDGWYQVQSEQDYSTVCEGGTSCEVADGSYVVINHSTGERFPGIVVSAGGGGGGGATGITVNGNTISMPNDGWYQVQSAADFSTQCEGVTSCTVDPGVYIVINHTSGIREEVTVGDGGGGGGGGAGGVTVTGNTISWPNDGWYQVQSAVDYSTVCEGGTSCEVSAGNYIVINHSTGTREEVTVAGGGGGGGGSGVTVDGNTISWPDDGWYQVQSAIDFKTVCEGGRSCDVSAGVYIVINHTTGERTEVVVGVDTGPGNRPPSTPTNLMATAATWFSVGLTWSASTDPDGDSVTYIILRDGFPLATTSATNFGDSGLNENTDYTYEIAAADVVGNTSAFARLTIRTPKRPVICQPTITGFALFDAGTDKKVRSLSLSSRNSINVDDFDQGFSIIAEANECTESIFFTSTGGFEMEQSDPPYAIANDRGDDIFSWEEYQPGFNTVTATPYPEDELLGVSGATARLDLDINEAEGCEEVNGPGSTFYLSGHIPRSMRNAALKPETDDPCRPTAYYSEADPDDSRTTLDDWLSVHKFGGGNPELSAKYVNAYDLGFGRKMRCRNTSAFPCVVQNFTTGTNPELIASVAMERRNGNTYFFVFDPQGRRINSVDLDGKGSKSVPEVCEACHYNGDSDYNGSYLAFDTELYFNMRDEPTVDAQQNAFRALNALIERAAGSSGHPTNGVQAMADELQRNARAKRVHRGFDYESTNLGSFSEKNLAISSFYAQYCRSCHVAQDFGEPYAEFTNDNGTGSFNCQLCHESSGDSGEVLRVVLCGDDADAGFMPNSRVTHDRLLVDNTFVSNGRRFVRTGSLLNQMFGVTSVSFCAPGTVLPELQ
ncbi:MAG: hypothetical protein KTR33_04880 [Gammaproteobacteria bacterium]|nr:hypothetical protein [Gammaproteobacteria bacterium]